MAGFYNNYGQTKDAIRYLEKTCKLSIELRMTRRAVGCQNDLAWTHLWQKDFGKATNLFEAAEKGAIEIEADDLKIQTLIGKAFITGNNGEFEQSLKLFAAAENLAAQKGEWTNELTINWFKSYILLKQKSFTQSLTTVERAIAIAETHQDTDSLPYLCEIKGKILLEQNKKQAARETLYQAVKLTEQGRTQMQNAASSIGFFGERNESYRNLIEVEFEENRTAQALIVADKLKSRWLIDHSATLNQTALQNESWQMSEEAKNFRRQIYQASENYLASDLKQSEELLALEKTYQEANQKHSAQASERFGLSLSELNADSLSALVPDDQTTIVAFAVSASNKTIAFVINKKGIKAVRLAVDYPTIVNKIGAFRGEITSFAPGLKQTAKTLYANLLSPIENEISAAQRLIFVPDLGLWELPFQALIGNDGKYLVEKHQISYVPSVRTYQSLQRAKSSPPSLLAFGNSLTKYARPLREAEREAVEINEMYRQPSVYIKEAATETRLKQQIGNAGIVHLAVHGKINPNSPFDSALLFTKDKIEDGRLTVSEILQLPRLPNSLIVLSGCDTSNGQVAQGEGLLSLSWAFLAAGGSRVVAAQWAVEERTTADLMIDFYRNLNRNAGKTAYALQAAQINALKRPAPFNHPFYWAGFVAVGAGDDALQR